MPPRDDTINTSISAYETPYQFKLDGHAYRCNPLSPLEQIHVSRKLAPLALSVLKPESGRAAVLQRLAKVAKLATDGASEVPAVDGQVVGDAIDLALSVLQGAAEADEEMLNGIIRKVMKKIFRVRENGGGQPCWNTAPGVDMPTFKDIDGFTTLRMVAIYLNFEFRERAAEYIKSLNLKPGPAFTAAMASAGVPRPPGAPV